uniref:7-deoxyloganetic acid glucosyltransferase-like n=1 Tax=Tanacetum cinerariifolium TaxID=118510 RepID=A0A6L2NZD2_TANCI|nr:7-deoxyloganetic acid glucosyltransferase-like [Tanacetum cinerariifolium]
MEAVNDVIKTALREMLVSGRLSRRSERPVTVLIPDGLLSSVVELGVETSTRLRCTLGFILLRLIRIALPQKSGIDPELANVDSWIWTTDPSGDFNVIWIDEIILPINLLPDKYENVFGTIVHREPFPNLKTVRSMLAAEEMRLKSRAQAMTIYSTSSSPVVLLASSGNSTRGPNVAPEKSTSNVRPTSSSNTTPSMIPDQMMALIQTQQALLAQFGYHGNNSFGTNAIVSTPIASNATDFMTCRVLLCCDSTGDLYLVTKPSTIPHAFPTSQNTWHQRLGHPGSEVSHPLLSSNSISCNKEKPPHKYAAEIIECAHMVSCNPSRTHVDNESKLGTNGDHVSDLTLNQSLAGALQYLTFTRLDISYAVQQVCLYMRDPQDPHFSALKQILSVEAEYRGVANVVAETCWLRNLLLMHQRTKHIEIDIHFVHDVVAGEAQSNIETCPMYPMISCPCWIRRAKSNYGVVEVANYAIVMTSLDFFGANVVSKPLFREMMISGRLSRKSERPVTVMILNAFFSFAVEVGLETSTPVFCFQTISPCSSWTCFFNLSTLIEAGEVPFKEEDMDKLVENVPGTQHLLRKRDLAGFCRLDDMSNGEVQRVLKEALLTPRTQGLIVNTFEELDALVLPYMRKLCPNIYPIGPLHSLHKARILANTTQPPKISSNSVWMEDCTCLSWLDNHPPKTVVYVSIGSLAMMKFEQLLEIWYGLVNSGKPFLWVRRPGSISEGYNESHVPTDLLDHTKEMGCIVDWAPQEDVLAHQAIGAFLTHSGWNSTMESIAVGVPMICWPYFYDQQVISRFVGEVWKVGVDIKDTCDRLIVEKAIRDVMDNKRDIFIQSATLWENLAKESISEVGSSSKSLARLVADIISMSSTVK